MTPLRKRFINLLEAKGFAKSTIGIYVAALAKISAFHNKSPLLFTEDDVLSLGALVVSESMNRRYSRLERVVE